MSVYVIDFHRLSFDFYSIFMANCLCNKKNIFQLDVKKLTRNGADEGKMEILKISLWSSHLFPVEATSN